MRSSLAPLSGDRRWDEECTAMSFARADGRLYRIGSRGTICPVRLFESRGPHAAIHPGAVLMCGYAILPKLLNPE